MIKYGLHSITFDFFRRIFGNQRLTCSLIHFS